MLNLVGGKLRKEVLFYVFEQVYFVKFNDLVFSFCIVVCFVCEAVSLFLKS